MTEKKQLGTIIVDAGIITVKTLERALARQKGSGKRLGMILEEMGVLTEEELIDALGKQFGFRTVAGFSSHTFMWEVLGLIPEDLAVQKLVFPLKIKDGMLAVATTDPFDSDTFDFLAKRTGYKIIPFLATRKEIIEAISRHYLGGKPITQSEKLKILVVDDSPAITNIILAVLRKAEYEVVVAHDGLEGLKVALSERPDLIICDAVMPRMDGYGLKDAIHGNPSTASIPIILLTSKASGEEEQKALDSGFADFIAKPVQPMRIVSRVKKALAVTRNRS